VLQCAAIGVPDEKSGEHIKLFIVVKPGATLTKDQVMEHMRANVTAYKVPKAVEFRDALPTSLIQRFIDPVEIANLVVYLASPLASVTNGDAVRAEGGVVRSLL